MTTRLTKPPTKPEPTPEPDTSDIPEANKEWFDKAKLVQPEPKPFVIKPQDKLATAAIRAWIGEAYMEGVNADKIANAVEHYNKVMAWQAANPDKVKVPD
jgi:hypothetical protein